jgi:phosphatidate cytidylyltransferase
MLKQRLLVALIFLPLFIWAIFSANVWPLWALIWAALGMAAWELGTLILHKGFAFPRYWVTGFVLAMGVLAALAPGGWRWGGVRLTLPGIFLAGFLGICLREVFRADSERGFANMALAAFALLMLGGLGSFFPRLRELPFGSWWFALLFTFNWIYDAGAYFGGRFFGRTKLVPGISPGKTVEGLVAGLIANALVAGLVCPAVLPAGMGFTRLGLVALSVVLGLLAQAGDLVESLIKRWSGLKDSAGIIPGHGGVLDKVDSSFFTAPLLYAVACWLLGA